MKNLLKAVLPLIALVFMAYSINAEDFTIPVDNQGHVPAHIDLIGADVFVATGTAVFGTTRPVTLYGYSVSSDTLSNFATLRDTLNINATDFIKLTLFKDASCYNDYQLNFASGTLLTCHSKLPVPVIFRNGISINLNANVQGVDVDGTSRGRWMFYFRYNDIGSQRLLTPSQVDPLEVLKQGAQ